MSTTHPDVGHLPRQLLVLASLILNALTQGKDLRVQLITTE